MRKQNSPGDLTTIENGRVLVGKIGTVIEDLEGICEAGESLLNGARDKLVDLSNLKVRKPCHISSLADLTLFQSSFLSWCPDVLFSNRYSCILPTIHLCNSSVGSVGTW
jgi:hypothetical protein